MAFILPFIAGRGFGFEVGAGTSAGAIWDLEAAEGAGLGLEAAEGVAFVFEAVEGVAFVFKADEEVALGLRETTGVVLGFGRRVLEEVGAGGSSLERSSRALFAPAGCSGTRVRILHAIFSSCGHHIP